MTELTIGTATARPGEITCGWFDAVDLPTGGTDRFPVIIAQGQEADGPVLWITASIHGGEHTGLASVHALIAPELISAMRGTLIAIPTLSPAGLRIKDRSPYYIEGDPNRLFPRPTPESEPTHKDEDQTPSALELAYRRLYDAIATSGAGALLDLHNAWINSVPFAFRDPVFFHRKRARDRTRSQAEALQARVGEMLDAFGFSVINEFISDTYINRNLHRSVSGAVLNGLGIPAFTAELGSWMHIDPGVVDACTAGIRNVMRWLRMLDGAHEPIQRIPVIKPGFPVRRCMTPRAPGAGIAQTLVHAGDTIRVGQPLARMVDIFGRPLGKNDGLLLSEHDGWVIGFFHGIVRYQNEPIMGLAIRDDSDLIVPYPD